MGLRDEIQQQPEVLGRLLDRGWDGVRGIVNRLRDRQPRYVFLAARGTSDNAGRYAKYLLGTENGLPMALAAASMFSVYHQPPVLRDALVVGISQSGQSPDILSVLEEGRRQGCPTLAIVNAPDSPLARGADEVIDIGAGREEAVAATKTYTAQLMAVAMLSAALRQDPEAARVVLASVPVLVGKVLELEGPIQAAAERHAAMERCVVLGRGYNFASAYEWSLKLKELAYVVAAPYSSADFQHGPIAMVEPGFPVLAVAPSDLVLPDLRAVLRRLREECRAELAIISDDPETLALAHVPVPIPASPAWISPMVAIVAAQLFCYHLTRAKGYDPEAPRGLRKVTMTS